MNGYETITIASQREGVVPVDREGKTLSKCIIWMDNRTVPQLKFIREQYSDNHIYSITGLMPAIYYSACKMLWIKQHQNTIYNRSRWFLQPGEYIAMRLTGNAVADLSMASRTMLLDTKRRAWSKILIEGLGISYDILPPLLESGSVCGIIRPSVASKLGINSNTKVIIGGGDQQCGAIGSGAIEDTIASISLGTSTTISLNVDSPMLVSNNKIPCCISAIEGMWEMEPSLWSSGNILTWLSERISNNRNINSLLKEADKIPVGSEGLLLIPYFMSAGSPIWNPHARGAFVGLAIGHEIGHLTRAILEGNAFDIKMNLEALTQAGFSPKHIVVNGGGIHSPLWCQIIADVTGIPVKVPKNTQAVSLGLFLLTHVALGYSNSIQEAARIFLQYERQHVPNINNHDRYCTIFGRFNNLVSTLLLYYSNNQ